METNKAGKKTGSKFEGRVRFNWGYHDGASDRARGSERNVAGHFDKLYAQGYRLGAADVAADAYTGCSQLAWKERASLRRAPWMPERKSA